MTEMAQLLTAGCIKKIIAGECPESFTFQLLAMKKFGEEDNKYRLIITDGEDKYNLALFDSNRTGLRLPGLKSILSVSATGAPPNLRPQVVMMASNKYCLIFYDFKVVREGDSNGDLVTSTSGSDSLAGACGSVPSLLVTPTRPQAREDPVEQPPPVKGRERGVQPVQPRAGSVKRNLDTLYGGQPASKVSRQDNSHTHEVATINPYSGKFKIKVLVESKAAARQINSRNYNGLVQDCVLTDSSGSIKMTAWSENVPQLDSLQEGKTYVIESSSNKITPVRDSRFNSTNHMFEMTWDKLNTKVTGPLTVGSVKLSYDFTKIQDLHQKPANSVVDVLGLVRRVKGVEEKRTGDGRELKMREVELADDSAGGSSISLVLWNGQAEEFKERDSGEIMALRKGVVKEFKGVKNLSMSKNGSWEISPDCDGAEELRRWSEGLSERPGASGGQHTRQGSSDSVSSIQEIKDLLAQDNSEKKFTVYGCPIKINSERMWYRAHRPPDGQVCRKKVEPSSSGDNLWNCRCGAKNIPTSQTELKYMVNLCISDSTSHVWAVMFEASSLFQMTAQELQDKKLSSEEEFDRIISAANFVDMKFSVSAKVESFNGAPKLKFTLFHAERVWREGGSGREMMAAREAEIREMERELGISHEEEFGIDLRQLAC